MYPYDVNEVVMSSLFLSSLLLTLVSISGCFGTQVTSMTLGDKKKDPLEQRIENLYQGISGFGIGSDEEKSITNQGGAPTYGEITYKGLKILIDKLKLTPQDVFYDLGSGVGKVVVQVFLGSPVKKCVGVELSPTRYNHAQKVKEQLIGTPSTEKATVKKPLKKERELQCVNQNIVNADISDATVVFMCSTCFSDKLMHDITEKLAKLRKGLRVITLKELPAHPKFKLKEILTLPMTWSQETQVRIYELVG
jgi:precorrin-6B methylase 2